MLRAGAAVRDITPELGTHLSGSGMGDHRPAQSVLDPLHARAIVFESGGDKVCILALDVCILAEDFTARVRSAAASRCGLPPDAIMVHSLQVHSAPSCGDCMLDPDFPFKTTPETEYLLGSESRYVNFAAERAIEAVVDANSRLQPVRIGIGRAERPDLAFNRREEGTIDPEVSVLCFQAADGHIPFMLLHYTCHPVNVFLAGHKDRALYRAVSADWPGVWAAAMQASYGPSCLPIVLNGCCGNINPGSYRPDTVWDHRRQGTSLAETAQTIVKTMTFAEASGVARRVRRIVLPYRQIPAARLAEVERILDEHPDPKWKDDGSGNVDPAWFLAASTKSVEYCRRRNPQFQYEIQIFRVGGIAFVGLPGEPFAEGQLAIKSTSPASLTLVEHMTTQYVGYLPTREGAARGGHEANAEGTYWAKLAPESLDIVVENASGMLRELF